MNIQIETPGINTCFNHGYVIMEFFKMHVSTLVTLQEYGRVRSTCKSLEQFGITIDDDTKTTIINRRVNLPIFIKYAEDPYRRELRGYAKIELILFDMYLERTTQCYYANEQNAVQQALDLEEKEELRLLSSSSDLNAEIGRAKLISPILGIAKFCNDNIKDMLLSDLIGFPPVFSDNEGTYRDLIRQLFYNEELFFKELCLQFKAKVCFAKENVNTPRMMLETQEIEVPYLTMQ